MKYPGRNGLQVCLPLLVLALIALLGWTQPLLAQPVLVALEPADGSVTTASEVTLRGRLDGARHLWVDGEKVSLAADGSFSVGPLVLRQGRRALLLLAEDGSGVRREWLHHLERDSQGPRLEVELPLGGVVDGAGWTLQGRATDERLASVSVDGVAARLEGERFAVPLRLAEGSRSLTVEAVDALGNRTQRVVSVLVDGTAPSLEVVLEGLSAAETAVSRGPVRPRWTATDASALRVEAWLDGSPFSLGSEVVTEGAHRLRVLATDAAGHVSERSLAFVIDRTAPTLHLQATAPRVAGGVTVRGVALQASSVKVAGIEARLAADGSFAVEVPVSAGRQRIEVMATDAVGNLVRHSVAVTGDSLAPTLTVTSPLDGAVVGSSPVAVSGTATDDDLAEVRVNGQVASLSGSAFSASVSLGEGSNALLVEAEDGVGQLTQVSLSVTLDTQPPTLAVTVDGQPLVDGASFGGPVTPTISADDATAVDLQASLDGQPYTSGTTVDGDGAHQLSISASDVAGNTASSLLHFTLLSQAPSFLDLQPADGTLTSASEISLSGRVTGSTALTVDGQGVSLVGEDFTAGPYVLTEGPRTFILLASGLGGDTSHSLTVTGDATAPSLTVTTPASGYLGSQSTIQVGGTASDLHLQSVTVNGVTATRSGSTWLAAGVPLSEGQNTLTARASDGAGNVSEELRTVTRDALAPELTIVAPSAGTVQPHPTLEVHGTVADPHLDRVAVNGQVAQLQGGTWSRTVGLAEGANTITVEAFDTLGHRATASVLVHRDSAAPSVAIAEPADGLVTTAEQVTVSGTVADEEGLTVTVNGQAATVEGGSFSLLSVPLLDGTNTLTARVTDAQGNVGSHTRRVVRDNAAPSYLGVQPASGALAVPLDGLFTLTFSEPLAEPTSTAWSLRRADGSVIAANAVLDGEQLMVTPAGPLASHVALELEITAQLLDLAGNPLSNPQTLTFTTVDSGAPPTPQVDPHAPYQCASTVTLGGSAEADAVVTVTGGASEASGRVAAEGSFALEVLVAEGLNRLQVVAEDAEGNASPAAVVDIYRDCAGPQVVAASLGAADLKVVFSEAVSETVLGAIAIEDSLGPVAGSVSLDATSTVASFVPTAGAWPTTVLRLEVSTAVEDLAGNDLAFPYVRLFGDGVEESFFSGTVLDADTGRPLAGARVRVTASGGVPLPAPQPEQTTGEDGRFLLTVPAGTHDLTLVRPGYTPVFRIVTTSVGLGADVFDGRLTPQGLAAVSPASSGTVASPALPALRLELPAGALPAATPVRLTALDEQSLPALLPYGWSPRGALWLDLGSPLATDGILHLPVLASAGSPLVVASLDLETLQWRALELVTVSAGEVAFSVPTGVEVAGYAALEADSGALAPGQPSLGQVLPSSSTASSGEVLAANLSFNPEMVLPSQSSRVTVLYDLTSPVVSGLPLTLWVQEELELLDGSLRRSSPYRSDLLLFHSGVGEARSRFDLRPSEAARQLPIRLGAEDVRLLAYGDEGVRGDVLGPEGGSILGGDGDRIDVPAGALSGPTAVTLERRTVADLPMPVPTTGAVVGVLELDFEGGQLLAPAQLSLALSAAPTPGSLGLLLQVVEVDGSARYRAVARIEATASGWTTSAIESADLPFPGVRSGGLFVFLELGDGLGFLHGRVLDSELLPVPEAVVQAVGLSWLALSDDAGRYVLPLPLVGGPWTVTADHPLNGDRSLPMAVAPSVDEQRLGVDLVVESVPPSVLEVVPSDGSLAPSGVTPTVRFSETIEPGSARDQIQLLLDGVVETVDVQWLGLLAQLVPEHSLLPGATYEIRIEGGLRDLEGNLLSNPQSSFFTVETQTLPSGLDPSRIRLIAPNPQGEIIVRGLPGSVPSEATLLAENRSHFSATDSIAAGQDGSFELRLSGELGDRIELQIFLPGATGILLQLGPYLSADERAFFVQHLDAEQVVTTADGLSVTVVPGTFGASTWVRLEPQSLASAPVATPEAMQAIYAFDLDFGGATAQHPLELRLPAPAGATDPAATYLVNRYVEVLDQRGWMMHDLLRLADGFLATETAKSATMATPQVPGTSFQQVPGTLNGASQQVPGTLWQPILTVEQMRQRAQGVQFLQAMPTPRASRRGRTLSLPTALASPDAPSTDKAVPSQPVDYMVGIGHAGYHQVIRADGTVGFVVLPVGQRLLMVADYAFGGLVPMLASSTVGFTDFTRQNLILPVLLGLGHEMVIKDLTTGYQLFRGLLDPPTQPLTELPREYFGDTEPPVLLSGSPLRFVLIQSVVGLDQTISAGVRATIDGTGQTMTLSGAVGTLPGAAEVRLYGLDDGLAARGMAAEDGSFELTGDIALGRRYLLAMGATLQTSDAVTLNFNESLGTDFASYLALFAKGDDGGDGSVGQAVAVEATPIGTREHLRLRPRDGWRPGFYRLRLEAGLADENGNRTSRDFDVIFKVEGSQTLPTVPVGGPVRDMVRLGSLLFLANDAAGVRVMDATDPRALTNYLPGELTFPLALGEAVRGVAADRHGRVFAVGGGVSNFGQLSILDVQAIDLQAIEAEPGNLALRQAAWRGSTLVSDPLGSVATQLPSGTPRRVAVYSDDDETALRLAAALPEGLLRTPSTPPLDGGGRPLAAYTVHLEADAGVGELLGEPGQPVTLFNLDRGTWHRVDAAADGTYGFDLKVETSTAGRATALTADLTVGRQDRLLLVRNRRTIAYVTIDGVGLAVVEVGGFYGETLSDPAAASQVLRYDFGHPLQDGPCDLSQFPSSLVATDVALLFDAGQPTGQQLVVPLLLESYGLGLAAAPNTGAPDLLSPLGDHCAARASGGTYQGAFGAMAVLPKYPLDQDDDGVAEPLDLVLLSDFGGAVVVLDITDRLAIRQLGRIDLAGRNITALEVDAANRRLFVAAFGSGVLVVDFDRRFPQPGEAGFNLPDDRLIEVIPIGGEDVRQVVLVPDLGVLYAGGWNRGLSSLGVDAPRLAVLAADSGPARRVAKVAPFGVPTGAESSAEGAPMQPGVVRFEAQLPGPLADDDGQVRLDILSLGPGGQQIFGAGDRPGLPATAFLGTDGLPFVRQADQPWQEGYQLYLSDPVVLLADLRAMVDYPRDPLEEAVCKRCDQVAAGVYDARPGPEDPHYREMLSGHRLALRLPANLEVELADLYGPFRLDDATVEVESVPWDISPSRRQEPSNGASYGMGDVVPGTLLHSGEFSRTEVDLSLPGRGLGLSFVRTYRSQTLGNGPLGPGWDHGYRLRLRPLPNGDVELFDGRGRRETFIWQGNGADEFVRFLSPEGRFEVLRRTTLGWTLAEVRGSLLRFDRFGRLTSLSNWAQLEESHGSRLDFHYDVASRLVRVQGDGRNLYLRYDTSGQLLEVEDPSGRVFRYAYDGNGRLTSTSTPAITAGLSQFPEGIVSECSYTAISEGMELSSYLHRRDNMTSMAQPRDAREAQVESRLTVGYSDEVPGSDRSDLATTQTWGGDDLTIAYDLTQATTTVTDRRGATQTYNHSTTGRLLEHTDAEGHATTFEYALLSLGQGDAPRDHGLLRQVILPSGQRTRWTYTVETEPSGDLTEPVDTPSQWSLGNVATQTVYPAPWGEPNGSGPSLTTTWRGYDRRTNRPQIMIDPAGQRIDTRRNAVGLPELVEVDFQSPDVALVPDQTATTDVMSDIYGQIEEIRTQVQPRDSQGNLLSAVELRTRRIFADTAPRKGYLEEVRVGAPGQELITRFQTDLRGNVVSVTDARGVTHERVYNALDWLVEERLATRVAGQESPPLTPIDQRMQYLYDARGNVVEVRRGAGAPGSTSFTRERFEYGVLDEVTQISREIQPQSDESTWSRQTLTYDANRNLTQLVGAEGETTTWVYDARNLPVEERQLESPGVTTVQHTTYNALGQPVQLLDERGHAWQLDYDGYDRLARQTDPLGHYQQTVYDPRGDVARQSFHDTDGTELTASEVGRDSGGRAIVQTDRLTAKDGSSETRQTVSELNELSQPRRTVDANGKEFIYRYDSAQRLVAVHSLADGQAVEVSLDGGGDVVEQVQLGPVDGAPQELFRQSITYDALGRPLSVDPGHGERTTFTYDRRGNRLAAIAPGPAQHQWSYDGLDRVVAERHPEGVDLDHTYDRSSRQIAYRDAQNQVTRWDYDLKSQLTRIIYPDSEESYAYDPTGNPILTLRPDGSEVEASYDAANRPIGRQITPVAGLGGVLAETFLPDALGRIERSTHGGITTEWTYDALSRIVSETQGSKTVSYAYDDQGNVTSLEYPSGMSIGRTHTPQNRILEVGDGGAAVFDPWVSYHERIPGLLEGRNLGIMIGSMSYDAAQRPTSVRYSQPDGTTVFGEELSWTTRDQLARRQRLDLNGWSEAFTYDAFDRLVSMQRQALDGEASPTSPAGSPASYAFTYDAVHNLLSREEQQLCSTQRVEMPSDNSGRHRPSSIGDQQLTWNANGELLAKGDLRFIYDFLGRLVKIEQETNGQRNELVTYTYDALNRRVGQHFADRTIRTVWDGWQPIEDYEIPAGASGDGELLRRRVYGRGIDEVIRLEQRLSVDNPSFDVYVPFYDSSGNVALLTSEDGDVVERYEYSPYGQRTAWADTVPPAIEQLRLANGAVVLELSEAVDRAVVEQAVQDGILGLHNTTQNQAVELTVEFPVTQGKQAYRRIVLRPSQATKPNAGDTVELTVASAAVVDYFDHAASEGLQQTFHWMSGNAVIVDDVAPRVATVCTDEQGHLEIQLSETTDPSTAATQIQVDGIAVAWTLSQDGYTIVSTSTLEPGSHDLTLGTGPLDLSGQGLETSYGTTFELPSESLAMTVDGGDGLGSTGSIVSNPLGFQGLHHDAVGGLVYVRNRYYDPEMGRFIQPDPLGFVDGPNVYQFAVGNPVNGRDPLGLSLLLDEWTARDIEEASGIETLEEMRTYAAEKRQQLKIMAYFGGAGAAAAASVPVAAAGLTGLWGLNTHGRYVEMTSSGGGGSFGNALALGFYDLTPVTPALELRYGYSLGSGEDLSAFSQGMNVLGVLPAVSGAFRTGRALRRGLPRSREVVVYAFRNSRDQYVRQIFPQASYGHVGFSFNHGEKILGFGPSIPRKMSKVEFSQAVKQREAFAGVLTNDTHIFESARSFGLKVEMFRYEVGTLRFWVSRARASADRLRGSMATKKYTFPPRGQGGFGPGCYNCATYPTSIGLATPIPTGQLSDVLKR